MDREQFGLTATAHEGHHTVADGEPTGSRTEGHDLTGRFQPRDVGRRSRWCGIEASSLKCVGRVQPRRPDRDQDLTRAGNRVGTLDDDKSRLRDGYDAHGLFLMLPWSSNRPPTMPVTARRQLPAAFGLAELGRVYTRRDLGFAFGLTP